MGRHASRWLPSLIKPQHRFVVAITGIVLLAFATLAVAASVFPATPEASAQPQQEVSQFPPGSHQGDLVGTYSVAPNAVWGTGFQAQVAITNRGDRPLDWQVTLAYPKTVMTYAGSWVDGVPQPNVAVAGQRYTFTSAVPVAPGQTALLRAEFSKVAGADFTVTECTVNGRQCDQ